MLLKFINTICTNIKNNNVINKHVKHAEFRECIYLFLYHGFIMVGWVSRKYHGFVAKGFTMILLAINKLKISKIYNFYIFRLIKQFTHFWCSSSYLRFACMKWGLRDCAASIIITIIITEILVMILHIGISIKKISTGASYNI